MASPAGADPVADAGFTTRARITIAAIVVFCVACLIAGFAIGMAWADGWGAFGGLAAGAAVASAFIVVGLAE